MNEKRWMKDPQNDVLARSEHAAEVVYEREQKAAREADQKAREDATRFDEQRREAVKQEQEKQQSFFKQSEQAKQDAQAKMLADAQRNNAQHAQQITDDLNPHRHEHQQVNYKELTASDRDRLNNAQEIRREFVERGEMRDSHALAYPVRGGNVYEQAANRELDADRDFANRQQRMADRINNETDKGKREYLETVKAAEYHSHKAESWAIIADQRKECGYCKEDIEYARNQAAGHELQAAQHLERMKELDMAKSQAQQQDKSQDKAQEQARQAPQTARQAPNEAQQGQGQGEAQKPQQSQQDKPLEQSQTAQQGPTFGKAVSVNLDFNQQTMRQEQAQPPRDMAVLNKIREQHGRSGLRDDIVKLEEQHNAKKAQQGEHSQGLRGDIERLEQRHNAQKAEREQGQQQDRKEPRRGSGLEM